MRGRKIRASGRVRLNGLTWALAILGVVVASILASGFLARTGLPRWLAYVYFLRVPLLLAAGIFGFTYAAFYGPGGVRALLHNAFDVDSGVGIGLLSFAVFLSASAIELAARLVTLYGRERFFVDTIPGQTDVRRSSAGNEAPEGTEEAEAVLGVGSADPASAERDIRRSGWGRREWLHLAFGIAVHGIAIYLVYEAILVSSNGDCGGLPSAYGCTVTSYWGAWWCAFLGFAVYIGFLIAVTIVQLLVTSEAKTRNQPPVFYLVAATSASGILDGFFDRFRRKDPLRWIARRLPPSVRNNGAARWAIGWLRRLPPVLGRGYIEYDSDDRPTASISPGHAAALALLALTSLAYFVLGRWGFEQLEGGQTLTAPALCYLLLLFTMLCWLLSSFTFFFDRYHIPVLVPLVVVLLASNWGDVSADYFYRTEVPTQLPKSDASSPDSIVVVAANGGGIQSAAWTARVLTGLEQKCREEGCDRDFAESIRLISSVSGGSVGTLYFVSAYQGEDSPEDLDSIVGAAEGSSLAPIGWGLLYPDFLRTIWPYEPEWDRGRALEQALAGRDPTGTGGVEDALSAWGKKALHSDRPDVIFNATVAETGQPLVLSTTDDLPGNMTTHAEFLENSGAKTRETDVSAVTAARLSAAYPYVSPAARAKKGGKSAQHVVDGGYYDNYGVSSLVDWLDRELKDHKNIRRVLVVRIHGAPTGPGAVEGGGGHGWFYQAYAPASTVLNVRGTGQRVHSKVELGLLADRWCADKRQVDIETATFEFDEPDSPLSWHLTAGQQQDIEDEWKDEFSAGDREGGWDVVDHFLNGPVKEKGRGC
jgi:hypothetical protein